MAIDTACASASLLINDIQRMINEIQNSESLGNKRKVELIKEVKAKKLYRIELQAKLFTISTTNVILEEMKI